MKFMSKLVLLLAIAVAINAHSTMVCLDVNPGSAADPTPTNRCKFHSRKFNAYNHFHDGTGGDESFAWVSENGPSWSAEYSGNTRNGCFLKGQGDSTPGQNGCVDWTVNYQCPGCKLAELQQGAEFSPMHYARGHAGDDSSVHLYLSRIVEGKPEYSDPNIDKTTPICTYPFRSRCDTGGNQATTPCWPLTPCKIPADVAPGNYTLVWRWIWKQTGPSRADYCSAADLKIYASTTPIPPTSQAVPTPSSQAGNNDDPVKVFVTVTVNKAPSLVSTVDFSAEVTGILNIPRAAIVDVEIDADQSTTTTTFIRFTLTNALKSDGTRVDPVGSATKLKELVTKNDASLESTYYLEGMKFNGFQEEQSEVASGDIGTNTTIIIIVCVVGGVVLIVAALVAVVLVMRKRKSSGFM